MATDPKELIVNDIEKHQTVLSYIVKIENWNERLIKGLGHVLDDLEKMSNNTHYAAMKASEIIPEIEDRILSIMGEPRKVKK